MQVWCLAGAVWQGLYGSVGYFSTRFADGSVSLVSFVGRLYGSFTSWVITALVRHCCFGGLWMYGHHFEAVFESGMIRALGHK